MINLELSPTLHKSLKSFLEDRLKHINYEIIEREDVQDDLDARDKNGNISFDAKMFSEKQFSDQISKLYIQSNEIETLLKIIKKKELTPSS